MFGCENFYESDFHGICRLCPVASDWRFKESSTRTAKQPKVYKNEQKMSNNDKQITKVLYVLLPQGFITKVLYLWAKKSQKAF